MINNQLLDDDVDNSVTQKPFLLGAELVLFVINSLLLGFVVYYFFSDNDWTEQIFIFFITIFNLGYLVLYRYATTNKLKSNRTKDWKNTQTLGRVFIMLGIGIPLLGITGILMLIGINEETKVILIGLGVYGIAHGYYAFKTLIFIQKMLKES